MNRNRFAAVTLSILALTFAFANPLGVRGQDNKNPYPAMAPLEQYLMDREAEIALARSAAPESISRDAKILVLENGMAMKPPSRARMASCAG